MQPSLPCGIHQIWLGPTLQQKADDSHPVVQGPPLQGVVPLRVCLIHLQGSVGPSEGTLYACYLAQLTVLPAPVSGGLL